MIPNRIRPEVDPPRAVAVTPAASPVAAALTAATIAATFAATLAAPVVGAQTPGAVLDEQKVSATAGGFTGLLEATDAFGSGLTSIGDLDGDGVVDLAVGALGDDDGGATSPVSGRGAVWILFMNADGTVKGHSKISSTAGGFGVTLDLEDRLGWDLAGLGDIDGDSVRDLAVCARWDDDGGLDRGAVYILFMNTDGTVKSTQKISSTAGGFTGFLNNSDELGSSVCWLGDLDGDTVGDIAVGAQGADDGGQGRGTLWILFLNTDGTVKAHQRISQNFGGLPAGLANGDRFGVASSAIGDVDGDGVVDIAVGAREADVGGPDRGAVWILFMNTDGTVKGATVIGHGQAGFTDSLDDIEQLGTSVAGVGDLDRDGVPDLAVGANHNNDGGTKQGAVRILFLNTDGTVKSLTRISETSGGFGGTLQPNDEFGISLAHLGDLDGDGREDIATGAIWDDDGPGGELGAVWTLFLDAAEWADLGSGLAGAGGVPELVGVGSLVGGEPVTVTLGNALPSSPAFLFVGFSELNFSPFFGGTLVPDPGPPGLLLVLVTSPAGTVTLPGTWPAGLPADSMFWMQCWVEDAGAPFDYAGSNALRLTTP